MCSAGAKRWLSVTAAHNLGSVPAFVFLRTIAVEISVDAPGSEQECVGEGLARQSLKIELGSGFV